MKQVYLILSLFILLTTKAQTTQDTLYVWKAGQLVLKQSIKPADVDSITFKRPTVNLTVTICSQVWATKNLDVTTYRNGDPIPQVTDPSQWAGLTTGAWCYYNNDPANGPIYGKLYNWYAVNDPRGLAPQGWHVPTDTEWSTLITCLGGESVAGGKMKETGTAHWLSPNTGATNSSGFTGLPGGYRNYFSGSFYFIGYLVNWWSSSESDTTNAWSRYLSYNNGDASSYSSSKNYGYWVRCLRD